VYVNAPAPKFAAAYRNVNNFLKDKVYISVQEFSQGGKPPTIADFARLELPKEDVDELKGCKRATVRFRSSTRPRHFNPR